MSTKVKKKPLDYPILITIIALVAIGVVMVFSASFYFTQLRWEDSYFFFQRQALWSAIGFIVLALMANIPYTTLRKFAVPFLLVSLVMLVAVLLVGEERNFATRWLDIGGLSLQPSEAARFALVLFLADSIAKRKNQIKYFFKGIFPYLAILGVFFGLILIQPNFSMAGSLAILTLVILFIGGMNLWHMGMLLTGGIAGAWVLLKAADYRMDRLTGFLNPWNDPLDTGYQLIQSFYALGSGGVFGMGFGQSRQKHLFIPHSETDFIFAIIGEELGFIGAVILIILFGLLIYRGIKIAMSAPDLFACLLAAGIISLIAIQVIINIAVVTGSIPPTGLPLPFISFGGSSLVLFMAGIGVLLNISKYTVTV